MGLVNFPERSSPAPPKVKPFSTLSDPESDSSDIFSELSATEFDDKALLTTVEAQLLWESESLKTFAQVCSTVSDDNEFDRLNNKLLLALKMFSSNNKIYCVKCKKMSQMTKRGKTKKTYQFACGTHTLSATQILGSLPDQFLLQHIPNEPRHVLNETLSWLGKDQLSPELNELSAKRNAVKRYSAHRSPIKAPMTSLLNSRNSVNEMLIELRDLKERVMLNENAMSLLKESNTNLTALNAELSEQLKLLKEENSILKRHLNEPRIVSNAPSYTSKTESRPNAPYAKVADISKPMNKIMKYYSLASSNAPITPADVISAAAPKSTPSPTKYEFSPLKVVFFKGCHRKSINEYKLILPKIGFEPHWARHICFLAEDIIQIITFESKVDHLIQALESISTNVKHLPNFDPLLGISYIEYGTYTDESASKCYISLMKQCSLKLASDSKRTPSLRRISTFIARIVETKNIKYQPVARATRVFCLGDFIVKKEPVITMEIDNLDILPAETPENNPTGENSSAEQTETDADAPMKDSSSTVNDQ